MFRQAATKSAKLKAKLHPEPAQTWKILRGDLVEVIQGEEQGKQGKVLKVIRADNRVIVESVNTRNKIIKDQQTQKRQSIKLESPLPISTVSLLDPKDGKPTKVEYKTIDGKKVRVATRTGNIIPKPPECLSRTIPRNTTIGPKDTNPDDVLEMTFNPEIELKKALKEFYPFPQ
ncbi:hypothetical protein WA158_000286 [Blastocystis sp. Blastoise]